MRVGREVILTVDKKPAKPGEVVLSVHDLHVLDDRHLEAVKGVDLEIREGEILGIAGVQGNGQKELVEAITGLRPDKPEKSHPSGKKSYQSFTARDPVR